MTNILFLVSASLPSSSGHLVVPALLSHEGLGMGVGQTRGTEVRVRLSGSPPSLQNDGVLAKRGLHSQLLEGDARSTSLHDSSPGSLCEPQSTYLHLGYLEDPLVISDSTDNHDSLASPALGLHLTSNTGQGDSRHVLSGHKQPLQDHLVEFAVGSSGEEPVQLHQQPDIDILGDWLCPVDLSVVFMVDVNTHVFL